MHVGKRQLVVRAPLLLNVVSVAARFVPVLDTEMAAVTTIVNSQVLRTPYAYMCVGENMFVGDKVALEEGRLPYSQPAITGKTC